MTEKYIKYNEDFFKQSLIYCQKNNIIANYYLEKRDFKLFNKKKLCKIIINW